jgi:hypothetical protein
VDVAELRRDPEQALLGETARGEVVWVTAGSRRLLLVSSPDAAREVLVERAGELAKPRSQAIPLGRAPIALPGEGTAQLRRELAKGMGADRADETAALLGEAPDWTDGDTFPLMPWLRPRVARAVVGGAFASRLSDDEITRLAAIVRTAGEAPRVVDGGSKLRALKRPFKDAQLSLIVRSLLANVDLSRPSELSAVVDRPPRERQALAGELLLGAVGPLVQESGWLLYRLGAEPAPPDPEAFVREVTRLHPTNPLIVRVATEDTSVGGEPVPAGTLVVVHVVALHLHPPEERFSYAAFGIGERRCLGEAIAMRSLVALAETVGRDWKLSFEAVDVAARGRRQLSDGVRVTVTRLRAR